MLNTKDIYYPLHIYVKIVDNHFTKFVQKILLLDKFLFVAILTLAHTLNFTKSKGVFSNGTVYY